MRRQGIDSDDSHVAYIFIGGMLISLGAHGPKSYAHFHYFKFCWDSKRDISVRKHPGQGFNFSIKKNGIGRQMFHIKIRDKNRENLLNGFNELEDIEWVGACTPPRQILMGVKCRAHFADIKVPSSPASAVWLWL